MVAKRRAKKKKPPAAERRRKAAAANVAHISKDLRSLARQMSRLRPDPDNVRLHDERNIETIRASLAEHGQQKPIVLQPDGKTVAAGSGTLLAARLLGWKWIAAIKYDRDPGAVAAYAVTDNRSAELATWDEVALARLFKHHDDMENGRDLVPGWSDAEIQMLLPGPSTQMSMFDDTPPPAPQQAESALGEMYELGPHRLFCGDSTDLEAVLALEIFTKPVDVVVTDPPYAIYGSSSGLSADITDDKIVRPFFLSVCQLAKSCLKKFGHAYIFCDWRSWASWWEMAKRAELACKNVIVWDKLGAGLGSNYANTYELIGFFASLPKQKVMTSDEAGQRPVLGKPNIIHQARVAGKDRQHNAAKPVTLLSQLIVNSSERGEIVADPFIGSGSTLIAAEQTGRVCYAVEIDPRYCDVTRQRYANFVGDPAYSPTGKLDKPLADGVK
jgi:DNA modification methylase